MRRPARYHVTDQPLGLREPAVSTRRRTGWTMPRESGGKKRRSLKEKRRKEKQAAPRGAPEPAGARRVPEVTGPLGVAAAPVPAAVAPLDTLVDAVKAELRAKSPFRVRELGDRLDLRLDLGLTEDLKRSLAAPFQAIARRFVATARVSRDECGDLELVGDAVNLVSDKAGFSAGPGR